jgi:hypothetical protein
VEDGEAGHLGSRRDQEIGHRESTVRTSRGELSLHVQGTEEGAVVDADTGIRGEVSDGVIDMRCPAREDELELDRGTDGESPTRRTWDVPIPNLGLTVAG